jgi:hypothetical protein
MTSRTRTRHRGVIALGAGLSAVAVLAPTAVAGVFYCGGGYGPTADLAIRAAIEDAENSASGDRLFACTLLGEPFVGFVQNDPYRGDFYRASVNMTCT